MDSDGEVGKDGRRGGLLVPRGSKWEQKLELAKLYDCGMGVDVGWLLVDDGPR